MDKKKVTDCEFYDNGKCSINDKNNLCDCQNNRLICSKIVAKTLTEEVRKQKEIEEMFNDIVEIADRPYYYDNKGHAHIDFADLDRLAEKLSEKYKTKIDKNNVVISKEEYEILKVKEKEKHWFETCMTVWKNAKIDGSKETAEKILNEIYQECKVAEVDVLKVRGDKKDLHYKGFALGMWNTKDTCKELAKQFGVEIKE